MPRVIRFSHPTPCIVGPYEQSDAVQWLARVGGSDRAFDDLGSRQRLSEFHDFIGDACFDRQMLRTEAIAFDAQKALQARTEALDGEPAVFVRQDRLWP